MEGDVPGVGRDRADLLDRPGDADAPGIWETRKGAVVEACALAEAVERAVEGDDGSEDDVGGDFGGVGGGAG